MTEITNTKHSREIHDRVIANLDARQTDNFLESLASESLSAQWKTIPVEPFLLPGCCGNRLNTGKVVFKESMPSCYLWSL